jgi:hypothetical protein
LKKNIVTKTICCKGEFEPENDSYGTKVVIVTEKVHTLVHLILNARTASAHPGDEDEKHGLGEQSEPKMITKAQ